MSRRFYLLVNGIRSNSNDLQGWQFRGERWIDNNTPDGHKASTYHYGVAAITRWIYQKRHIKRLSDIIKSAAMPERDVVLVGHSNGAALICGALKECPELKVRSIHLFAGAEHADCDKNGLNKAAEAGQVGSVHLYGSKNDDVLKRWASLTTKLFGWAGLGYGQIGRTGPVNPGPALVKILKTDWRNDFGHSTWWNAEHFVESMRMITAPDPVAVASLESVGITDNQ